MFDEEFAEHLYSGLFHLEFAREMLLRTGNVRAFERYGWAWGDEAYTGMPESHVVEDNLSTLFQMTEPRLSARVSALVYLNEASDEWWRAVLHPDGRRVQHAKELHIQEEDFGYGMVVSCPDAALLERYRSGLARLDPMLRIFVHDPEPQPHPPTWMRRSSPPASEPTTPNFLLLIDPWSGASTDTIYNHARRLVGVWESERSRRVAATRRLEQTFTRQTTFGPTHGRNRAHGRRP